MCNTLNKLHFWNRGRIQARKKNMWKASYGSFYPVTVSNSLSPAESQKFQFPWRACSMETLEILELQPSNIYIHAFILIFSWGYRIYIIICKKFLRANMKVLHSLCSYISLIKITTNTVSTSNQLNLIKSL